MKLNYYILSSNPLRIKCFYEQGTGDNKRYGEFYLVQTRKDSFDANNPTDKLGVRGELEVQAKDKDYAVDLLQGFAEALRFDLHLANHAVNLEEENDEYSPLVDEADKDTADTDLI